MKKLEKIFNRYNVLSFIILLLGLVLCFRLATLTIVKGDYYRDMSNNKRLKEIHVTGARGEIRDRYGRLLAGNKPSFTVQISKDELNIKDKARKNEILLGLIRLLEEDGVRYIDNFPIDLNVFKYKTEKEYTEGNIHPDEKVIEILIENNLLKDVIGSEPFHSETSGHYYFSILDRAIYILQDKGIEIEEGASLDKIASYLKDDKIMMRKMLDHPITRKIVYDILKEKNLNDNILIEEYSISFDEEYKNIKRDLMYSFDNITEDSSAKDDFANIVVQSSLNNLLEMTKIQQNKKGEEEVFLPGEKLITMIKEIEDVPIEIELSEDNGSVIYKYTGQETKKKPIEILIEYAKKTNVLKDFITSDEIKYLAQEQLLNDGINTKISVSKDFEYVPINNKNNWLNENNIKEYKDNKEIFEKIKDRYEIGEEISKYEARAILFLYEKLNKQGHMAYQPINIAYGIKNETVAKIEEKLVEYPGINISIEPVRYYPEGKTAAHILGYLGKISQSGEIKKYVEEREYSPNDIIGKTGIEESFEDYLRGEVGIKKVEVDVFGNTTNVIDSKKPVPGNNIYLTIDARLQKIAEEALKKNLDTIRAGGVYESKWGDYKIGTNKKKNRPYVNATSGAVVALDVKTGEVLAMASYPSYDPNLFSTGISNADWLSLFPEDEKNPLAPRPLYNVATQTAVQPGSIFKMVTGLAALEKGLSPTKYINSKGYVEIGEQTFGCWIWNQSRAVHGNENLYDALRDSCNYYFYSLALGKNQRTNQDIGVKVEIEDIVDLSKKLGLNDKTGIEINIPNEYSGGVPNPQRKIILSKQRLENYLNKNIKKYLKNDIIKTEKQVDEIIEEIVSWLEYEIPLTRGQVISKLEEMDIDSTRVLPGQTAGLTDVIKYDYLNFAGWNISDTLNVTIGQGQSSYTPIQMANYISTISNGGYKYDVSLIKNVKNYNNSKILLENEPKSDRIDLNNYDNLNHIKKGMLEVTTEGSARRIFDGFPIEVGAKTGTAQKSGINPVTGETYDDFAWFVAFAPYDEPEIAIATVIFQGGSGGYAGPLTRDIIGEYLGLNAIPTRELLPFKSVLVQ